MCNWCNKKTTLVPQQSGIKIPMICTKCGGIVEYWDWKKLRDVLKTGENMSKKWGEKIETYEKYIMSPYSTNEAAYPGNLGFVELCQFWDIASKSEKSKMDDILQKEDWIGFKRLINKVVEVKLKD